MTKKKTINIKEHLEDDTLDLSMCGLQEVPVKEIAATKTISKATNVDISSNQITSLGNNFAKTFIHIVKLDLSNNQLRELPDDFGLLVNLKHLDLYKNRLETLPTSCANLRSLRWLDVKENPLVPVMARVAGSCLNQAECKAAAVNVVKFFIGVQKELEENRRREEAERVERMREEEQKALKKEQKKKRQKMKKNAAKMEEMARVELNRNGGAIVEEVDVLEPIQQTKSHAAGRTSILGRVGTFLYWLLNSIIISSTLFSFLVLIGICLIDEVTYIKCIQYLGIEPELGLQSRKILLVIKENLLSVFSVMSTIVCDVIPFLLLLTYRTAVYWWKFLFADGIAFSYLNTLSKTLFVSCLSVVELSSNYVQKLITLVQGYFNN